MTKHFLIEIEKLNKKLLHLATKTEKSLQDAVKSLKVRDTELAENVIEQDAEIDTLEVEIEEDCLKILALYQPVAKDLRFVVAVLKINNDLERIGDLAVNIAERSLYISSQPQIPLQLDFEEMAKKTLRMVRESIEALINGDTSLARKVLLDDDMVDEINREMYAIIQDAIKKYPEHLETLIHLLSTSRHLERVADHATNIAEDVIYLLEGEIVRHRPEDYRKKPLSK